jgi:hypothetical protein
MNMEISMESGLMINESLGYIGKSSLPLETSDDFD